MKTVNMTQHKTGYSHFTCTDWPVKGLVQVVKRKENLERKVQKIGPNQLMAGYSYRVLIYRYHTVLNVYISYSC